MIVANFKQYVPGGAKISGLAEALLIGYKEDLDKDLVQAYSNTGVVHIIAISGLHLGLIYAILVWVCERLPYIRKAKILQAILVLSCLWIFSILTGSSASVLRSAVMFTCIIIGKNFFRQASAYNALATSAFILLVFNPYLLWDTSFQLSYLAVFGIMWLQRPLYEMVEVKNKWLDKIWAAITVTLAAQLLTTPVCIFYFHQFPLLFLITNLLAVPLSTIILFAEIFLLLSCWFPPLALLIGKLVFLLITAMNFVVDACNNVSWAMITGIPLTVIATWLLYVVMLSLCSYFLYKNKRWLFVGLMGMTVYAAHNLWVRVHQWQQKGLLVYNLQKHTAMDIFSGNAFYTKADQEISADKLARRLYFEPARLTLGLNHPVELLPGWKRSRYSFSYGNHCILYLNQHMAFKQLAVKVQADVVIISGNPAWDIREMLTAIKPGIIVFDASNSLWKIEKWKRTCEQLFLPAYSIPTQGAFLLKLD